MPYVDQLARARIQEGLGDPGSDCYNAGELNFLITKICNDYLGPTYGYQKINDIVGALEGAKMEFYRRIASPYEDIKIQQNGDVYE